MTDSRKIWHKGFIGANRKDKVVSVVADEPKPQETKPEDKPSRKNRTRK